jgi:hypothetical protein
MPALRRSAVLLPLLLLAACDSGGPGAAGGVSAGEAEALEDAAEMLDEQRSLPPEALPAEALPPAAAPAEMTGDSAATAGQ